MEAKVAGDKKVYDLYLLDPTGKGKVSDQYLAEGVTSLKGLRVGILSNQKPNADAVLEEIERHVIETIAPSKVARWAKRFQSIPAPPNMLDEIAGGVDIVFHGVGD